MLKGLDPLLGPDLLHVLAAMGHGDELVIADANFPAASIARRLVRLDGVDAPRALRAVLSVLPIDTFTPTPAAVMAVVGDPGVVPPPVRDFQAVVDAAAGRPVRMEVAGALRLLRAGAGGVRGGRHRRTPTLRQHSRGQGRRVRCVSAPAASRARREAPLGRPATGRGRILAPDVPGVALTYKPTGISARRGRARRRPRRSPDDRGRRTRLRASPRPHRQAPPRRSTPLLAPGNGSTLAVGSRPRANPRRCRATGGAATRAAASGRSGTLRALVAIVSPRSPPGSAPVRPRSAVRLPFPRPGMTPVSSLQGRARRVQAPLLHPGVLGPSAVNQVVQIDAVQTSIRRGHRLESLPESLLAKNSERHCFERLERARGPPTSSGPSLNRASFAPSHAVVSFSTLEPEPTRSARASSVLRSTSMSIEQALGEATQRLAGVPIPQCVEDLDGRRRPRQVIPEVDRE